MNDKKKEFNKNFLLLNFQTIWKNASMHNKLTIQEILTRNKDSSKFFNYIPENYYCKSHNTRK